MDFSKCNYEMAEFLRRLPNLSIFNNFRSLMKQIWKAWMPKQRLSISQQLEAGCRYLDIRISKYRSAFYGEHGLYTKQFKKYLKEIKEFLEENTKEVIIMHLQLLNQLNKSDKRRLVTVLFQVFGARLSKVVAVEKLTLKYLWNAKKQLIIVFPKEDMHDLQCHIFGGLIWCDDIISSCYPKAQEVTQLVGHLDEQYRQKCDNIDNKRFNLIRAVLSPDMTMVFGEYQYKSMRELTRRETNLALSHWLQDKRHVNLFSCDFLELHNLAGKIISLNTSENSSDETQV